MTSGAVKRWSFMPVGRISPLWWLPVVMALTAVDYFTGPYFQLPAAYILPVTLAAWFSGSVAGVALAAVLPLSRLTLMLTLWDEPWDTASIMATAVTRVSVFMVMAVMAARLAEHERALGREVQVLSSLLPICTFCRKIRDADDEWETLETYVSKRKGEFSAGLCPDCAQKRFPEHFQPEAVPR